MYVCKCTFVYESLDTADRYTDQYSFFLVWMYGCM